MCLLATWTLSFEKCFYSFANRIVCFAVVEICALCNSWILILCQLYSLQIFSLILPVCCSFYIWVFLLQWTSFLACCNLICLIFLLFLVHLILAYASLTGKLIHSYFLKTLNNFILWETSESEGESENRRVFFTYWFTFQTDADTMYGLSISQRPKTFCLSPSISLFLFLSPSFFHIF